MSKSGIMVALVFSMVLCGGPGWAGWKDFLGTITGREAPVQSEQAGSLAEPEIASGLKQALDQGIRNAVRSLGQRDGFLQNPKVRIPMPDQLEPLETVARSLGQGEMADQFVRSMNRAAEKAVPETLDILTDALRQMSLADARSILNGPADAATRYFERTSRDELAGRINPIVSEATNSVGVTQRYKNLVQKADPLTGMLGSRDSLDVDGYVTGKTLDGLFLLMAEEEQRIRENPAARTTELLQKVFGWE
ncbi:MAG: DUF4197 domain-containing protein [Desulfovibrionales bacterium]